jgi:hypothetical protein
MDNARLPVDVFQRSRLKDPAEEDLVKYVPGEIYGMKGYG